MKLSEYIAKTEKFGMVDQIKKFAKSDIRIATQKGGVMIYQTTAGLLDVTFEDGEYTIYHTEDPIIVNGEVIVNQIIHYQGADKKEAVNVLMNLYDIQVN